MSNHSKKHHYVPQSLLRYFSFDQAQTKIHVFDKSENRSFLSSVRNAGCENYFNTVEVEGQTFSFENFFGTNDDQLAQLLNNIISQGSLTGLNQKDRYSLSEVVAAQIVRTKMVRTTIKSIAAQLLGSLHEIGLNPGEIDGLSIPTDQEIRRIAFATFLNHRGIIDSLQRKQVFLVHNHPDSKFFWISDNPVAFHNTFPYGEIGLNAPGIEIYFPISPNFTLGFYCPSIEQKIRKFLSKKHNDSHKKKYEEIYRGLKENRPFSLGSGTVSFLNGLQVLNSSRFLYAQIDGFDHVRKILSEDLKAQKIDSLVSVGQAW